VRGHPAGDRVRALAGLPVELGLYAALVFGLVYSLLGSSRPLSVSVTSTISIITAHAVSGSDDPAGTAALLALLAGGILLGAGSCGSASSPTSSPCRS
jgi:MFS superfamily sulfate permease-like transporter